MAALFSLLVGVALATRLTGPGHGVVWVITAMFIGTGFALLGSLGAALVPMRRRPDAESAAGVSRAA
ncbi:MAG TPA: hypothetical protein VNO26_15700 [Candidatus Limnocylindria bacterium]|nr:hypothetical protein [Candidatus Limnocylindria bacterium]